MPADAVAVERREERTAERIARADGIDDAHRRRAPLANAGSPVRPHALAAERDRDEAGAAREPRRRERLEARARREPLEIARADLHDVAAGNEPLEPRAITRLVVDE